MKLQIIHKIYLVIDEKSADVTGSFEVNTSFGEPSAVMSADGRLLFCISINS
jgi:hypothetical protein